MDLVNTTSLVARVDVAPLPPLDVRVGTLLAKATFRWDDRGELALDTQSPEPLWLGDEPSPLGLLPRDDLPREGEAFEIVILGCAHAEDGAPIARRRVAFELGGQRREMLVTGDRRWEGEGEGATISETTPFLTMPLGWERAFGGETEVEIDEGSSVPVTDPRNPAGRGFDPEPIARSLGATLKCPPPFPRWERTRLLPNVEGLDRLVTSWADSPDPIGWGAPPVSSPLASIPLRASKEGIVTAPPADRRLRLEGLAPGAPIDLVIPELEVTVDAAVGARRATRPLRMVRWVVRSEERLLTATYRLTFSLAKAKGEGGSMRLRVA
jgi:hypothetical protein